MKGGSPAPPRPKMAAIWRAFGGSLVTMLAIVFLHETFLETTNLALMMAPLGASAVLVFGVFNSPLAQPRNVVGGHVISGLIGVTIYQWLGPEPHLAAALAVSLSILVMHLTKTLHPPGGATAFIGASGGLWGTSSSGYWFVVSPCALGSLTLVLVGVLINNLPKEQRYPQYWW